MVVTEFPVNRGYHGACCTEVVCVKDIQFDGRLSGLRSTWSMIWTRHSLWRPLECYSVQRYFRYLESLHLYQDDQLWSYTGYPSEPILSAAAAELLYKKEHNLANALTVVSRMAKDRLIEIRHTGELSGRFLWLLAKDLWTAILPPLD